MNALKNIVKFIGDFIKKHYLEIFFLDYLFYIILYFIKYNSNDFGYTLVFTFLFIAVTGITEIVTIDLIWISIKKRKEFIKQIKKFEKNHKECKKENIMFLEGEKIKLYQILFKEYPFSILKFIILFLICFVHIGLIVAICLKLFIVNGKIDWSVFTNAYPYTVFLLYFMQIAFEDKLNKMYIEMQHRGERIH